VAVGFPANPRLLVTIILTSISFFIWPQAGGSLFHIYLAGSHFLAALWSVEESASAAPCPRASLPVSASSSSGPGSPWGLTDCYGSHTGCSASSGKTQHALDPTSGQDWDHAICQSTHFSKEPEACQSAPAVTNAFQQVLNPILGNSKN
jgi:hypothetical protein